MSTSLQIKQIHTLKNILGLDDDLYREMLASFGVYSSKKLTETEANILIEILQDKTKKLKLAKPKKYDDLSERDSKMSTPLQLRKIEAIWWDICNTAESVQQIRSLRKFVKRQCKIDDIKFLSKREASKLIAVKEKVMNMMTMKMEELVAECEQAKLKFADIMLDDNADYRCKDSRRLKCTNIEAQMDLLQSMMDKISNMTCEVMLPPMARI